MAPAFSSLVCSWIRLTEQQQTMEHEAQTSNSKKSTRANVKFRQEGSYDASHTYTPHYPNTARLSHGDVTSSVSRCPVFDPKISPQDCPQSRGTESKTPSTLLSGKKMQPAPASARKPSQRASHFHRSFLFSSIDLLFWGLRWETGCQHHRQRTNPSITSQTRGIQDLQFLMEYTIYEVRCQVDIKINPCQMSMQKDKDAIDMNFISNLFEIWDAIKFFSHFSGSGYISGTGVIDSTHQICLCKITLQEGSGAIDQVPIKFLN